MVFPLCSHVLCAVPKVSLSAFPVETQPIYPRGCFFRLRLQITYDVLPLVAFLGLVAVAVGCYMFYAGNKVGITAGRSRTANPETVWTRKMLLVGTCRKMPVASTRLSLSAHEVTGVRSAQR